MTYKALRVLLMKSLPLNARRWRYLIRRPERPLKKSGGCDSSYAQRAIVPILVQFDNKTQYRLPGLNTS